MSKLYLEDIAWPCQETTCLCGSFINFPSSAWQKPATRHFLLDLKKLQQVHWTLLLSVVQVSACLHSGIHSSRASKPDLVQYV